MEQKHISIQDSYRGKTVLVTGTSGFLGKVWLAMVLDRMPEIGKLIVILRKKGLRPVSHRFEKMVNTSPVFKPLHDRFGAGLSAYVSDRVEVVEGDIALPDFGTDAETAARLKRETDLIVNCAGLVDFNPDVRQAIGTNIDGALYAADFAAEADARLVHVSTCYVQGRKDGRVAERVEVGYAPNGETIDPRTEYEEMLQIAAAIEAEHETPEAEEALQQEVREKIAERGLDAENPTLVKNMLRREREQKLRRAMAAAGTARADGWGWPNTYTWSKSLAEQLLVQRAAEKGVEFTILRPAIVESSQTFPFPGWNEGFNTSGPLVYLLGTWLRQLPCRKGTPFDVIPVDQVCNAVTIAGAAVLAGCHAQVYQASSSGRNMFPVQRAVELTALAHRTHLRKYGETAMERIVLSRWDGTHAPLNHTLSVPNVRRTARGAAKALRGLPKSVPAPVRKQAKALAKGAEVADKQLKGIEKVLDLFKPFTHDHRWIFEAETMRSLSVAEPEFRFEPEAIDWRQYWMGVHVPGLRRWTFPVIEGKAAETFKPTAPFKLQLPQISNQLPAASGQGR